MTETLREKLSAAVRQAGWDANRVGQRDIGCLTFHATSDLVADTILAQLREPLTMAEFISRELPGYMLMYTGPATALREDTAV